MCTHGALEGPEKIKPLKRPLLLSGSGWEKELEGGNINTGNGVDVEESKKKSQKRTKKTLFAGRRAIGLSHLGEKRG